MVELIATGFGWIETARARFDTDIVIYPDNRIESRYRYLIGDSHTVGKNEVVRVLAGTSAHLVIGTGQEGIVQLAPEAAQFLWTNGIEYHLAPTPDAIKIFNQLKSPKAAILHVTC
ncbi:MAG: MTH938/NDUFAF3 family protein [bacterium]